MCANRDVLSIFVPIEDETESAGLFIRVLGSESTEVALVFVDGPSMLRVPRNEPLGEGDEDAESLNHHASLDMAVRDLRCRAAYPPPSSEIWLSRSWSSAAQNRAGCRDATSLHDRQVS